MKPDFNKIAVDAGLKIGEPTSRSYSVTGEPYEALTDCGIVHEGQLSAYVEGGTEADAWARYEDLFRRYLANKRGSLYWRTEPEIAFNPARKADPRWAECAMRPHWRVCSRLLVSERAVADDPAFRFEVLMHARRLGAERAELNARQGFSV